MLHTYGYSVLTTCTVHMYTVIQLVAISQAIAQHHKRLYKVNKLVVYGDLQCKRTS